jgi:large subunit ribosomal protein L17
MRHGNLGRKLGRTTAHRIALMRNLSTALFTHGRIRTTEPKAKELARLAAQMVTLAKRGDLHARRQVLRVIQDDAVVSRLFSTIAPWYATRQGGYTRILKLGKRPGDNADMAFIELVDRQPLGVINTPVPQKKKFKNKGAKPEKAAPAKAAAAPKSDKPAKAPAAKAAKAPAKPKAAKAPAVKKAKKD